MKRKIKKSTTLKVFCLICSVFILTTINAFSQPSRSGKIKNLQPNYEQNYFQENTSVPKHLVNAQKLVKRLDLSNTNYEHGEGTVIWDGTPESHTDCSGFIDHLLTYSYGYSDDDFKRWFDSHRPTAERYHDAIIDGRGFKQIHLIQDLRPGDFIAIKYLTRTDNTGHIMLVAEEPEQMADKDPIVDGTQQWSVTIIDSSESGHGPTDTRHKKGDDGKDHDGVGKGVFRIYTDKKGKVAGFAWSTLKASEFKSPDDEHLVMGRLIPDFRP